MVIVDTSVWVITFVAYRRGSPFGSNMRLAVEPSPSSNRILCEVLQGVPDSQSFTLARDQLLTLPVYPTGGADLAIAAAAHYRTLRGRGRTVRKTIDCLIATFCLLHGHTLLHNDRDFDVFEQELGLSVLHPGHS